MHRNSPSDLDDIDARVIEADAGVQAALEEQERLIRRARAKGQKKVAQARREARARRRERERQRRLADRVQLARSGEDERVALAVARYEREIASLARHGISLDLRVLAQVGPLDALLPDARTYDQALDTSRTTFELPPRWDRSASVAPFPDGVPVSLLDAWALLCAVPSRHLKRLFATRWSKRQKKRVPLVPITKWPKVIRDAARVWREGVSVSDRNLWCLLLDEDGKQVEDKFNCRTYTPYPFSLWSAVADAHVTRKVGIAKRSPGLSDTMRQQRSRNARRQAVEDAYQNRCGECGRTRGDGVAQFNYHHLGVVKPLGRNRADNTYAVRRHVLAHVREHEVPPADIRMLCAPCHGRWHRQQALARKVTKLEGWYRERKTLP
jgi:hypothetical protein